MVRPSHASRTTARTSLFKLHLTIVSIIVIADVTFSSAATLKFPELSFEPTSSSLFRSIGRGAFALRSPRSGHTSTLQPDGRVLIIGGDARGTAEIFDPVVETSELAGSLAFARFGHTATLLQNGSVLVVGGIVDGVATASTEIYDTTTGKFSAGPMMNIARSGHTATRLPDGTILFAGGGSDSAEIFTGDAFVPLAGRMKMARTNASAILTSDGHVFIVGGDERSAELFDPTNGSFTVVGNELSIARTRPHLRLLADGKIQIIGGSDDGSMEIYDPASDTIGAYAHVVPQTDPCANLVNYILNAETRAALFFIGSPSIERDRSGFTVTELGSRAVVIGGVDSSGVALDSIEIFDSSTASVTTDKLDYAPGERVRVTGSGFVPGESIRVMIHEDPHTEFERGFEAVADAVGNFAGEYLVRRYDLRMKFVVGARGLSSGRTAQTTFTDASPGTLGNFATQGLTGATVSVAPTNVATNATFSNLTRGSGLTAASLANAFNSSGWTTAATPDANDYYEFTITPSAGFQFSATELRVGLQRSSTGPPNLALRSSLDGFVSNIGPVIAPPSGTTATTTISLTTVTGLQNSTVPVTLRFYGYGASSGAGTLRIERVTSVPMVGLEVDGTVSESCVAPSVTTHPVDVNVTYGQFAMFTAAAAGTGTSVVWEVSADDGSTWVSTGVTTPTLSFQVIGIAFDGKLYRAVFSNSCGASMSNPARLTVGRKPLTPIVTADGKTYDGDTNAIVTSCSLEAVEPSDVGSVMCVVVGPTTFADANAGAGKLVTATNIGLAGSAASNYVLTSTAATTIADIDRAPTETDIDCPPGTFVYAASEITPCTASVSGANLSTTADVVYANNLNAGAAMANAGYAGDANHFGSVAEEVSFAITKKPATWTTNNNSRFFGSPEPSPVSTGSGSGFFPSDGVSASYSRGSGASVGTYHITANLSSSALGNYEITNSGATFTIVADPTSITADANVDGENGDCTNNNYTATLKDTVTNAGLVGVALRMTIGTQQATSVTDATGVATFTLTLSQTPGTVQQTFQLDASWADPNRASPLATPPRNFQILGDPSVEPGDDADSMYTGSLFFWTTSSSSSTATLTLSATIKDAGGECSSGDITRARVSFFVSSNGGSSFSPVAQNLPVGLVNPNERNVGTANATSQYNIGSAQSATLIVRVVVGGFYNFSSSDYDTPITIGRSGTANSLIGGGKLRNDGDPFVASGYIGLNSISSTFSTHVQYNKRGTNPQGDVTLYVRSCNFPNGSLDAACIPSEPSTHHVYFIKSNAISELSLIGGSASFSSKASVSEVMSDDLRVSLDGGNTMQLLFTPFGLTLPSNNSGNPIGATCMNAGGCASIIVYRSSGIGGGVWYSSSWGQPANRPLQTWLKKVVNGSIAVQ